MTEQPPPRRLSPITDAEDLKFYQYPKPAKEILNETCEGHEMARVTCPHTKESATMTAKLAGVLLTVFKDIPRRYKSKNEDEAKCPFTKLGNFIAAKRYKGVIKNDDDVISGLAHKEAASRYAKKAQQLEKLRGEEEILTTAIMEEQSGRNIVRLEVENKTHRARLLNPNKTFEQLECEYLREYLDSFEGGRMVLSNDEAELKRVRAGIKDLGLVTHRFVPIFEYIPGNEEIEE